MNLTRSQEFWNVSQLARLGYFAQAIGLVILCTVVSIDRTQGIDPGRLYVYIAPIFCFGYCLWCVNRKNRYINSRKMKAWDTCVFLGSIIITMIVGLGFPSFGNGGAAIVGCAYLLVTLVLKIILKKEFAKEEDCPS